MYVIILYLPISGLSEVIGMMEDTVFKNIVRESRMVTPVRNLNYQYYKDKNEKQTCKFTICNTDNMMGAQNYVQGFKFLL